MKKEDYNWWEDPKNKAEIERISWWNKAENKQNINFPVSIVEENGGTHFTITFNDETNSLLGKRMSVVAGGKTKEEAIEKFFMLMKMTHEYTEECRLSYQRFVPFRKGDWKHTGGRWFIIFGFQVFFRYGKGMKHGFYIPFTNLNINFSSEWKVYNKFKKENKKS